MESIVNAIEKISEKSVVDYLLIIVPIVISLVAVFISVFLARRQNKIAMFEIRYRALATIKRLLNFNVVFYVINHPRIIIEYFNGCFEYSIDLQDQVKALLAARMNFDKMEETIIAISDILDKSDKKILEKTFEKISTIINNAIMNETDNESIKDFKILCFCLKEITVKKLARKIMGTDLCFDYVIPKRFDEPNKVDVPDILKEKIIADIVKAEDNALRK